MSTTSISTQRLFVFQTPGEVTSMLPLLAELSEKREDFKFITLGAAAKSLLPQKAGVSEGSFKTLLTHQFSLEFLKQTPSLDSEFSSEEQKSLRERIRPKVVIVGTNGKMQEQFLTLFPQAAKIAFLECYDYKPEYSSFERVKKICSAANIVFCANKYVCKLMTRLLPPSVKVQIAGKPSLDLLAINYLTAYCKKEAIQLRLGLNPNKITVVFFQGKDTFGQQYYSALNPFFERVAKEIPKFGIAQAFVQPAQLSDQKASFEELLLVGHHFVGGNSSLLYEAALFGPLVTYIPLHENVVHHAVSKRYAGLYRISLDILRNLTEQDVEFYQTKAQSLIISMRDFRLFKKENILTRQQIPGSSSDIMQATINQCISDRSLSLTPWQGLALLVIASLQLQNAKS